MRDDAPELRLPKLDTRLQAIADCVPRDCRCAADIGADHGRLSCYLLSCGIARRMIVSDISPLALSRAEKLITTHGLGGRARFIVADGLSAIDEPVDAVVISGMGGKTIAGMLSEVSKAQGAPLILSPHTQPALLRHAIYERGYHIDREIITRSAGRYYTVMVALPGQEDVSEKAIAIGHRLEGYEGAAVQDYLRWRLKVTKEMQDDKAARMIRWLEEELSDAEGEQSDDL